MNYQEALSTNINLKTQTAKAKTTILVLYIVLVLLHNGFGGSAEFAPVIRLAKRFITTLTVIGDSLCCYEHGN